MCQGADTPLATRSVSYRSVMAVIRPDNVRQARILRLLRDDGPRSRAELGYEPSVRLHEGRERTVRHFQEQKAQPGLPSATARVIEAA